jgi:hypothetical protein
MKRFSALILAFLCSTPSASAAPKTIPISEDLAANADKLKVKMGAQWFGHIAKWQIGDYTVVSSQLGTTYSNSGTNFLKTKSDSGSSTKFSFVMSAKAAESVTVIAQHGFRTQSEHEFRLTRSVSVGSEALIGEADIFTARIRVNADTSKWMLWKASTINAQGDSVFEAYLTNGERKIVIAPVMASLKGKHKKPSIFAQLGAKFVPPAMGYEFVEDGRSICAIQTYGGYQQDAGRMVWMHRGLEPRDKLVLVAAITAILQYETAQDDRVEE